MRYDVTLFPALYWTKFNLNSQTNRYVNSELIKKIELVFGNNFFYIILLLKEGNTSLMFFILKFCNQNII